MTTVDFKTVLDRRQLSALGAGRLRMSVARQATKQRMSASADLFPRFVCDLFDCVLSPTPEEGEEDEGEGEEDEEEEEEEGEEEGDSAVEDDDDDEDEDVVGGGSASSRGSTTAIRGLAWLTVSATGRLDYRIKYEEIM